jgi:predicted transcriptional regulator
MEKLAKCLNFLATIVFCEWAMKLKKRELNVLTNLAGKGVCAPEDLQKSTGFPLRSVYNYVNRLLEMGCIELVDEKPIRGTVKRFYRASLLGLIKAWELNRLSSKETLECMSKHSRVISILYRLPKFREEKFIEWISSFVVASAVNQVDLCRCADYLTGEKHGDKYYLNLLLEEIENQTFVHAFRELSDEDKTQLAEELDEGLYKRFKRILADRAKVYKQLMESFKEEYEKHRNMMGALNDLYKQKHTRAPTSFSIDRYTE